MTDTGFAFDLHFIWFLLLGVLLIGHAVLDGFDLGVGILHLLTKTDRERRLMLNSIGPVWDGNEVWLVTAGGALFAAFPDVYADRKSTRLNSSHSSISYAVFCLKKKKN